MLNKGNWLVVGISGATCSGKSTVAKELQSVFPNSIVIHQDDYFYEASSDKHTWIKELNHINFEILSSIDMRSMKKRLFDVLGMSSWMRDFKKKRTMLESKIQERFESSPGSPAIECLLGRIRIMRNLPDLLILDGFLLFNDEDIYELCDLRFYFTTEKGICWERRKARTYDPPDVPGYFEKCVWPHYLIYYERMLRRSSDIKFIDGKDSIENNFKDVLHKIIVFLG